MTTTTKPATPPHPTTAGNRRATEILRVLHTTGQASAAQIAAELGIAKTTAAKTLAALETAQQIDRTKGGHRGSTPQPDLFRIRAAAPSPPALKANKASKGATSNIPAEPGTNRLPKGRLAAMVLEHLRDNPDRDLKPVQVARALGGRSTGAVANALHKFVAKGLAELTSESPQTFRLLR